MKTIDEVICAIHHCGLLSGFDDEYKYDDGGCPYGNCLVCEQHRQLGTDILYYLNKYKKSQNKTNRHSKESTWDKDIQHDEFLKESQERGRQGIYE